MADGVIVHEGVPATTARTVTFDAVLKDNDAVYVLSSAVAIFAKSINAFEPTTTGTPTLVMVKPSRTHDMVISVVCVKRPDAVAVLPLRNTGQPVFVVHNV